MAALEINDDTIGVVLADAGYYFYVELRGFDGGQDSASIVNMALLSSDSSGNGIYQSHG